VSQNERNVSISPRWRRKWWAAVLLVALEGIGCVFALIEAVPHDAAAQPSFDEPHHGIVERQPQSWRNWESAYVVCGPQPIVKICIGIRGAWRFARESMRRTQNLSAMGYVVPNRSMGRRFWAARVPAPTPGLAVFMPAQVLRVTAGNTRSN